jgi:hypothetical protein
LDGANGRSGPCSVETSQTDQIGFKLKGELGTSFDLSFRQAKKHRYNATSLGMTQGAKPNLKKTEIQSSGNEKPLFLK